MIESNLVNLKQGIGLPGASKKLQKGNTGLPVRRQTGKEHGQLMPFACIIGHACRIATQETEKTLLDFSPGKGQRSEVGCWRSEMADVLKFSLKNAVAVKGKSAVEPAGTEKNTEQNSFTPVKSDGKNDIGNSLQHLGLKGEAKAIVRQCALADGAFKEIRGAIVADPVGENLKDGKNVAALVKDGKNDTALVKDGKNVAAVFRDGGLKENWAGKDEGRGQRSEMADVLKFSLKNAVVVKGKSAVEPAGTEKNTEKNFFTPVKSDGKNDIGDLLKHLGLKGEAKAVVRQSALADSAFKEIRGAMVADPVGENLKDGKNVAALFKDGKNVAAFFKDGKNVAAVFRDGGLKENGAGKDEGRGQRSAGGGQRSEMADVLKFSLKNAAAVKGKSAVETDKTEKNFFTPVKSDGKNDIGDLLKPLSLNGEETAAWHKKTGVKEFPDHKIGIPQPERSSDRGFSVGGYHNNTTFHASNSSSAVNESASSYEIKPRALINQIANGAKMSGRVRIALNPPSLGTLDMDVLVRDNKVHVILQVENNDVRQILQSNLESLKSSLRNQGLVVDTINVSVQEKSNGANHGPNQGPNPEPGHSETLFREGGNREGNEEDQKGGQDSLNHDPSSLEEENQRDRSDRRISLFA